MVIYGARLCYGEFVQNSSCCLHPGTWVLSPSNQEYPSHPRLWHLKPSRVVRYAFALRKRQKRLERGYTVNGSAKSKVMLRSVTFFFVAMEIMGATRFPHPHRDHQRISYFMRCIMASTKFRMKNVLARYFPISIKILAASKTNQSYSSVFFYTD